MLRGRGAALLAAAGLILFGIVLALCRPTRPGPANDLEIYKGTELLFASSVGAFEHRVMSSPKLALTPFMVPSGPGLPPMGERHRVRFRSHTPTVPIVFPNGTMLRQQQEVHLFTRSPDEYVHALVAANVDDARAWKIEAQSLGRTPPSDGEMSGPPFRLPADVVIPYPLDSAAGAFVELEPLQMRSFWPDAVTHHYEAVLLGPGVVPNGTGSIKQVATVTHGPCSTETAIQPVLSRVKAELVSGLLDGACTDGLRGRLDYLEAASYIGPSPNSPERPRVPAGGFLLRGRVHVEEHGLTPVTNFDPCDVTFLYDYRFALVEGRLGLQPKALRFDYDANRDLCSGVEFFWGLIKRAGVAAALRDALEQRIPDAVLREATDRQIIDRTLGAPWACNVRSYVERGAVRVDNAVLCEDAIRELTAIANVGAAKLGLSSTDAAKLAETISDARNWQCVARGSKDACTPDARCEFVVRAKSLTVLPDMVELDFFDSISDTSHSGFAAFVVAAAGDATDRLCSRRPNVALRPEQGDLRYYNRLFASIHADGRDCDVRGGPRDPIPPLGPPPPPPPPPPIPMCGCASRQDCFRDHECRRDPRTNTHECRFTCNSDADCLRKNAGSLCVPLLGLCSHQPCTPGGAGYPPMECPSWTRCVGYTPGGPPGQCEATIWDRL